MLGLDVAEVRLHVLPRANYLHLVGLLQDYRCPFFRRAGNPEVIRLRQGARPVCLDAQEISFICQAVDESLVDPERWLLAYGVDDFLVAHHFSFFMLGIAEAALQVTPREADENGGRAGKETLALQAIEYLVNLSHR